MKLTDVEIQLCSANEIARRLNAAPQTAMARLRKAGIGAAAVMIQAGRPPMKLWLLASADAVSELPKNITAAPGKMHPVIAHAFHRGLSKGIVAGEKNLLKIRAEKVNTMATMATK